jgi:hypothetical protein
MGSAAQLLWGGVSQNAEGLPEGVWALQLRPKSGRAVTHSHQGQDQGACSDGPTDFSTTAWGPSLLDGAAWA